MGRMLRLKHAELVNPNKERTPNGKVWYLPHFGIYHPKKLNKIKIVFDASVAYGVSSNKALLTSTESMNSIIGVHLVRKERVKYTCDVE